MSMQPAVHSRSTVNGFGRRRGDREMGTRPENRPQSGKSNSSGRLPNTGNKSGGYGIPSRDRLVFISTCFIGQHVDVQVKSGAIYSGIFHAMDAEKDFGIVLKMARMTKGGLKSSADFVTKAPSRTLIIPSKEFVQVIAKDVPVTRDGFSAEVQPEKPHDMMTDSNISQPRFSETERELGRWVPDKDDPQCPDMENVFEKTWNRGWNQFEANETLFGVKSTFDEELYTTKLDRGPQMREREREAQRIAREIEGEETRDLHLAEERGFQLSGKYDVDEETRFSSVIREKIDDSDYEESEDSKLDSCNDETFGDSSTSSIKTSTDWTKEKYNDVVRTTSTSCAVDQAQCSQLNVGVDRYESYDLTRQLATASIIISSTLASESSFRGQENQLGDNVGINEINESSEKQTVPELIHLSKPDDSAASSSSSSLPSMTAKRDGPDKEVSPKVNSSVPSRVSAKVNEKLNSTGELADGPGAGKPHGQVGNSHGRPGSSTSSRSDYVASHGLSPSSSVGSLSSEKSSLNPHAKEFKLNPNAKSFVPSPMRPPSPVAEGSFYYPPNIPAVPQMPGMPIGIAPPPFGQQVVFNPQGGPLPPQQAYFPPNGPQYGQQMYVHPRQVIYMPGYHQPETQYRGREY